MTRDSLGQLRRATLSDLGAVDPDALTFGAFSKADLVDALNSATSCVDQGGYFTVVAPGAEMMVVIKDAKIHIHGVRRTP